MVVEVDGRSHQGTMVFDEAEQGQSGGMRQQNDRK